MDQLTGNEAIEEATLDVAKLMEFMKEEGMENLPRAQRRALEQKLKRVAKKQKQKRSQ